eukprot:8370243-Pyramimonas_sp.AAC.1
MSTKAGLRVIVKYKHDWSCTVLVPGFLRSSPGAASGPDESPSASRPAPLGASPSSGPASSVHSSALSSKSVATDSASSSS